jgi:hypothetical protein
MLAMDADTFRTAVNDNGRLRTLQQAGLIRDTHGQITVLERAGLSSEVLGAVGRTALLAAGSDP